MQRGGKSRNLAQLREQLLHRFFLIETPAALPRRRPAWREKSLTLVDVRAKRTFLSEQPFGDRRPVGDPVDMRRGNAVGLRNDRQWVARVVAPEVAARMPRELQEGCHRIARKRRRQRFQLAIDFL